MATKYVSALTGSEMDSALQDMAYHNSEAWAVGTRNGTAVSSSDVTYHNNSKYYSDKVSTDTQRAEDAAARAEAAVPAGTAGAVFFDTAQSLTASQQAQARANIMAGGTNPNLLDNPFWSINQREATTVTTNNGYIADRWYCSYGSGGVTATRETNGTITITPTNSSSYADTRCKLEPSLISALAGRTVTVSIMMGDGTLYTNTLPFPTANGDLISRTDNINLYWNNSSGFMALRSYAEAHNFKAIKLELGSVSTLANDVPPDYGTELAKCQYYFVRYNFLNYQTIAVGMATDATTVNFSIWLPVTMRDVSPTISVTGTLYAVRSGSTGAITLNSPNAPRKNCLRLIGTTTSLTALNPVPIYTAINAVTLDISADL